MKGFAEYGQYDAMGLAELVRKGEISPAELCEEAIQRIEKLNPKINAVVFRMDEEGRQSARGPLPDGPFFGVPFLLKDLLAAYAGVPLSDGCRSLKNRIPDHDSEMVIRFKNAGVVILGKTNTPEFGLMAYSEPELFGPCRNPWNLGHTPGGSSGGAASAVAAGIVPMASGGDGGGSIRIPAAYCGLFGFKPSRGRNPWGPDRGRIWQGAVQEHVISRSVRDSAAMLDATQGADVGAPYEIRPPKRSYLKELESKSGKFRIAFSSRSPVGTPVHAECVKAVREAADLLEKLGHHVEEKEPEIDGRALAKSYLIMNFAEVAADIDELAKVLGRKATQADVEQLTWTMGLLGKSFSAADMVDAMRQWDKASRVMGGFFQHFDLYLTPTVAFPAPRIGELKPKPVEVAALKIVNSLGLGGVLKISGMVDQMAQKSFEKVPFTQLANVCGLPAMSVPLHWTPDNFPIGVQFIAPFGDEAGLFRLAGQLEKAKPWFEKRPEI